MTDKDKPIIVIDIGTTSARCFVFNSKFEIIGRSRFEIELKYPEEGFVEIESESLLTNLVRIVKEAIEDAQIQKENILCLGVSCQRSTFITWDKETGRAFHELITWKDMRSQELVKEWNSSISSKIFNIGSSFLHTVTRKSRFKQGSIFKLTTNHVTPRLVWMIKNNKSLQDALKKNNAVFGTLDSWLLFRLKLGQSAFTKGSQEHYEHVSDISSCSATGFFDPFAMKWASWAFQMFPLEKKFLPKVVDNSYDFGTTDPSFFGVPIKIAAMISDQSASFWGNCCFNKGDTKITLGTGAFMNIHTGSKCRSSEQGFYPMVGWKIVNKFSNNSETSCFLEKTFNDTALIIQWGQSMGFYKDPEESSKMATSVMDTDDVYFIPGLIKHSKENQESITGFVGIKTSTTKNHLVRAMLEGIAFCVAELYYQHKRETRMTAKKIRVDGGLANNDFICQTIADLCDVLIERGHSVEMTSYGTAYLCSFNMGILNRLEDISKLYQSNKIFVPKDNRDIVIGRMRKWREHQKQK